MEANFELRKFVAPEFVFGLDARLLVGRYLKNFAAKQILLVTDKGVQSSGWVDDVTHVLKSEGCGYEIYSNIEANPRAEDVMKGVELYQNEACDVIVAIGGGSPMDCAKGIGIACSNNKDIRKFEGIDRVSLPSPPLICIPTTAGSSADVSQFAIISDQSKRRKMAIISKKVVPDVALVDPVTTITLNRHMTVYSGFDVLSHAVEAYVSNASSPITDIHSIEAIKLFCANILPVLDDPENIYYRGNLMLASLHAGLAFSNASLGLVHAMAHSLGGLKDLPHGELNALLLEHVINFNFEYEPERYLKIANSMEMGTVKDKTEFINVIKELKTNLGIHHTLKDRGVKIEDISDLAYRTLNDPCIATNPVIPEQSDVEAIFKNAL